MATFPTHDLRKLHPYVTKGDQLTIIWTAGFLLAIWLVAAIIVWLGLPQPFHRGVVLALGSVTTLFQVASLLWLPRRWYETNAFFWLSAIFGFITIFFINRYSGGLESPFFFLYLIGLVFIATYVHPDTVTVFLLVYMMIVLLQAVTDPDDLGLTRGHLSFALWQIGYGVFVVFHQITMAIRVIKEQGKRELAEKLAKENQRLYEQSSAILDHMSDGVMVFDDRGRIQTMNREAEVLTDVSAKIAHGQSYKKIFIRPPSFITQAFGKKVTTVISDMIWITQSGSQKVIDGSITPVEFSRRRLYVLLFRDVTEKKAIEQAKEEYLITTSHQLNTPIAMIKIGASLLEESRLSTSQKKGLKGIETGLERLSNMVKELLNLSTLKDPHEMLKREPVPIQSIVRQVIEKAAPLARAGQVVLYSELTKPPLLVTGDESRLVQAFFNIVDNGIRYNAPKGRVVITARGHEKQVEIEFRDTGRGIEKQYLGKIFTPFFRIEQPGGGIMQMSTRGTGMGLYIARKIIEAHSGRITVKSEVGKGSVFTVVLPTPRKDKK